MLKPVHGEDGRGNYVVAYCQEGGPAADSKQVPVVVCVREREIVRCV